MSTGAGPVTLWKTLSADGSSGRGSRAGVSGRPDKAQDWDDARSGLDALLTVHQGDWPLACPPILPDPALPSRSEVRGRLRRAAVEDLPWWNLAVRTRARREVARDIDRALDHEVARIRADHAQEQADADRWWQALLANDPDVVADQLETAYADNLLAAVPAAIVDDVAHVAMTADRPEHLVGEREPTVTGKGNLSLAKMTKTRRNELYGQAVVSSILAVAAETFAVAPGITRIELAVVQPDADDGPAVIALAELDREHTVEVSAGRVRVRTPASTTLDEQRLVTRPGGRTGSLTPLPTSEDDDLAMLLDTLDFEG